MEGLFFSRHNRVLLIIFGSLFLLYLGVVKLVGLHCFSYYDLGIYSEALNRIQWSDWNPFIPGRDLRIFNDHFDPILIPFAFLTRFFAAPYLGITIEFLCVALCWLPIRSLQRSGRMTQEQALFAFAFLILNPAMVGALTWPFHPTTFGTLPLICLFAFYFLKREKSLWISFMLLCMCREEFPLIGFPLSLVLFFERRHRIALSILATALAWTTFIFYLRPLWLGTTSSYGGALIESYLEQPLAPFLDLFRVSSIRFWLERLSPLALVLPWKHLAQQKKLIFYALLIASPILAIRFLSQKWGFHYGPAAVVCLFFICFPFFRAPATGLARWRARLAWVLLFVFYFSPTMKNLWDAYVPSSTRFAYKNCPLDSARLEAIEQAQSTIAKSDAQKILLQNQLAATQILKSPEKNLYFLAGPQPTSTLPYDMVLIEKPPQGDAWMIGYERITTLIEEYRKDPEVHVIRDDKYIFFAEGMISKDR